MNNSRSIRTGSDLFIVHRSSFTRRGSTLLMALLIMTTMLAVGLSVGQIIFLEINLVKSNNETIVATYAAESALEQGAYRVRVYADTLPMLAGSKVLSNNASWTRTASSTVGSLVLRPLPKDLTRGFDLYDPESGGAGGREAVSITVASCDGSEWIELGYQSFDPSSLALGTFKKIRYPCPAGTNQVIYNNDPQTALAYRLYVRYVQGNSASLSRVDVTACTNDNCTGGGNVVSLPGFVDVTALGSFRNSTRTMDLIMPRLSPITGIFDYGIFSECSINKDPTNPSPSC
jgi:hypothetical protein